jgi:hypothetical protein
LIMRDTEILTETKEGTTMKKHSAQLEQLTRQLAQRSGVDLPVIRSVVHALENRDKRASIGLLRNLRKTVNFMLEGYRL